MAEAKTMIYLGAPEGFEAAQGIISSVGVLKHIPAEQDKVAEAMRSASALLDASMKVRITDEMVEAAPNLRIISTATTGADHVSRKELDRRSIPVRTLKEDPDLLSNLTPAAELSWALLMACARRLVPAVQHTRSGHWVREEFPGIMLNGRTLGVIGCGRIGQWMARYARAFGMDVLGYDPLVSPWPDGITKVPLTVLAETADFVSVHVHLTEATRGLVSADIFTRMKAGAVFINTSRGSLADEAALLLALEEGRLGAAGLDVLEGEPDIGDHPLVRYARSHDNLLITPHCGGFSPDAVRRVCAHAAGKIVNELKQHR